MSVLQNLFNFMHSNPRASHFKVKDLNVFFKHSLKPSYKLINLEGIDALELQIEQVENESKGKCFNLVAYVTKQKEELDFVLGIFETRKEANEALHTVKNQLYSRGKTLITLVNYVVITLFFISLLAGFVGGLRGNSGSAGQNSSLAMPTGSAMDVVQMNDLQKKLLSQAMANGGAVPSMPGIAGGTGPIDTASIVAEAMKKAQNSNPITGEQESATVNIPPAAASPVVDQTRTPGDDLLKNMK